MSKKLDADKETAEALLLQAQLTEYMHAMLRQNGIAMRLDEEIGI